MSVNCPMCLKTVAKLKTDSHILPKFFLRPIRDGNGRIKTINVIKAIVDVRSQDLPKGDFICEECESVTARLDAYGAKILKAQSAPGFTASVAQVGRVKFESWTGLEFQKFRNFLLSIAVRDHCWRKSSDQKLILNDTEYEKMRVLLMGNDSTDDFSFPIIMNKIEPHLVPNLHLTTSPPAQSNSGDAVTFMGHGFAFMIYKGAIPEPNMAAFAKIFGLARAGTIRMPLAKLEGLGTWRHAQAAVIESYKKSGKGKG